MAKNNVGKKPISQEEYTTNKVLAVFSVCLLGVLVLMILERLLGYSNTWKTGVLVTRVLLGVGIVGAAAGIIMLGQEHAGKRSSVRRIVCGRNMLIASIVAIVFLTAINYYGTMPIKAMYVVLPVLAAALLHPHDLAVGGLYFFKMLLGGWVVGVQVGMILLAFLAVGFFDGLVVGTGGDAQNAVRIGHFCFPSLCLRIGAYLLHTPE